RRVMRPLRHRRQRPPACTRDMEAAMRGNLFRAGTSDMGMFHADGKKSGHGIGAWLPAPADPMPARPPWPQGARHQVIALLDSGVQPHDWLPAGDDPPFVVDATEYGWSAPDLPG